MKNANQAEVEEAKRTGVLREDRMYAYEHGDMMVHGKRYKKCVSRIIDFYKEHMVNARLVVAEDADGELRLISVDYIRSPIKGPAQTPKKQRKPHVKGTKPERKIPFTADMRLKAGDKVLLSNGLRGVIGRVDTSDVPYYVEDYAWFHPHGGLLMNGLTSHTLSFPMKNLSQPQRPKSNKILKMGNGCPGLLRRIVFVLRGQKMFLLNRFGATTGRCQWRTG